MSKGPKNSEWHDLKCTVCGRPVRGAAGAEHCGAPLCEAMLTWDDERWAGQARMADARLALAAAKFHGSKRLAGVDELDLEALRRREERACSSE